MGLPWICGRHCWLDQRYGAPLDQLRGLVVLKKAKSSLLEFEMEIRKASTVKEIHQVVKDALFFVKGTGELYDYDTALQPERDRISHLTRFT